jgi:phage terminase large subunit-like protein
LPRFDQDKADAACNFFQGVLKNTQDEWAGAPFLLAPWQVDALQNVYGWLDDDGNRLIQQVYLEVPKKSGKTEFAAGIILLTLLLDQNIGSQVYGAAAAQRQALNVYRAAATMVALSPLLKKRFKVLNSTHRILKRSDPNSFYAAIAADGDLTDGVNPSAVIGDEVHRWRTRKQLENWDVLSLGGFTRRQSLSVAITTAGVQSESPLAWRLHEKTLRIRQGVTEDPTFYGRIYAADQTDDWKDEKTWIKANPSLIQNGGFVDIAKLRAKFKSFEADPEGQRTFKRYFLNLWDQKEKRAIDLVKWDQCAKPWRSRGLIAKAPEDTVRPLPGDFMTHFIERKCWAGVDMSMTTDMTAVAFVFPDNDGYFDVLPFFWMPEDGIKDRELRDGMTYRTWADQGFIELCEGSVIDVREIRKRLDWGRQMFDLQEVCFDPSEARQLSTPMIEDGYTCVDIRQGYAWLSEPCKKILELVVSGKFRHGGNPVLRWNAFCLSTKEHNDQLMWAKPQRMKDQARIDGMSAAADGMARAMLGEGGPSIYETRGIKTA